jgi:serine/threonine protein kinase
VENCHTKSHGPKSTYLVYRAGLAAIVGDALWLQEAESSLRSTCLELDDEAIQQDADRELWRLLGPTDDPHMLGRIGNYEVIGLIGRGGMGIVFRAFDSSLHRIVAIEMMLPHLAASGSARKRFARETQAAAAVVDEHVMAIHCVDEWQGVPYLVMNYSRGTSLQRRINESGPLHVRECLRIALQVAKGLSAAHAQGIIHRDVKPANILLDQNVERAQLMDFGLARAFDDASLTRTGLIAGTPRYMSPEQVHGVRVDFRSDLFSLGATMYAMYTGHSPFRAESAYGAMHRVVHGVPRPIQQVNPDIPEWLCAVISQLIDTNPSQRFATAGDVVALLGKCLAHVQQPAVVALPFELVTSRAFFPIFLKRHLTGIFAMCVAVVFAILLVLQIPGKPGSGASGQGPINQTETQATVTQQSLPATNNSLDSRQSFEGVWVIQQGVSSGKVMAAKSGPTEIFFRHKQMVFSFVRNSTRNDVPFDIEFDLSKSPKWLTIHPNAFVPKPVHALIELKGGKELRIYSKRDAQVMLKGSHLPNALRQSARGENRERSY